MADQQVLDLREVNGIEMGVLADGTAFLTGRALAKLCGVAPASIIGHKDSWSVNKANPKLKRILDEQGFYGRELFIQEVKVGNADAYAYPDVVCMALLEYFSFEAQQTSETARTNYRTLARKTLRDVIYKSLGYDPEAKVPPAFRQIWDRLLLDTSPKGYFNVFKENADFMFNAIRLGLPHSPSVVPDISIGQAWSKYWTDNDLESKFGARKRYEHNYPDDYPQAASNPQHPWVYPIEAIAEFKKWMINDYTPNRFPAYLKLKVEQGILTPSARDLLLKDVVPLKALGPATKQRDLDAIAAENSTAYEPVMFIDANGIEWNYSLAAKNGECEFCEDTIYAKDGLLQVGKRRIHLDCWETYSSMVKNI